MGDIQPREKTKRKKKKLATNRHILNLKIDLVEKGEGVKLINVETNETWVHAPEKSHLFPFRQLAF